MTLSANLQTPEGILAAQQAIINPRQRIGKENAELIAATGTMIDPATGQLVYLSDAQVTDYLVAQAGVSYEAKDLDSMMKIAAGRKPERAVRETIFDTIGEEIGANNLIESFKFEGGQIDYAGKVKPDTVLRRDDGVLWRDNPKGIALRKMAVTARLVRHVAQAAYDYERLPKTTGKDGQPPPTLQEYIHGLLRPETNPLVRQLDEATMQEHVENMTTATQAMRDAYQKKIWQNRYPVQP